MSLSLDIANYPDLCERFSRLINPINPPGCIDHLPVNDGDSLIDAWLMDLTNDDGTLTELLNEHYSEIVMTDTCIALVNRWIATKKDADQYKVREYIDKALRVTAESEILELMHSWLDTNKVALDDDLRRAG